MAQSKQTQADQVEVQTEEQGSFAKFMEQNVPAEFRAKTDAQKEAVQSAVKTLAQIAVEKANFVSDDALKSIEAMIAEIDAKLTAQVNEIIHHEDYQALESSWLGLHYLVSNTETNTMLKIRVLNVGKSELGKTLRRFKGASSWMQSPVFKMLYQQEYGQWGGEPYGCLVGDYYFDHSPQDVEMLGEISKIAASAHSPFLAAASPSLMNLDSWQELPDPKNLAAQFTTPTHAAWRSLRESEDARYIGLTLPRFLARLPYGASTNPVEEFDFEEDTDGTDHNKYGWANSAFAMARNINRAFTEHEWCAQIRGITSGGLVEDLPVHTFPTTDGGVDMKCPTEVAIPDDREGELAQVGLIPLTHRKNSDVAAFIGAQSLHKPPEYLGNADATANAKLGARLPYLFSTCRFAHYLKCIVRDKIGSFKSRLDMQTELENWIGNYVLKNPDVATDSMRARQPLAGAEVTVEEVEGDPGFYTAKFFLRPHYQLEGVDVSLRLVSKLPSEKK